MSLRFPLLLCALVLPALFSGPVRAGDEGVFFFGETPIAADPGEGVGLRGEGFGAKLTGRFQPRVDVTARPATESARRRLEAEAYVRRARLKLEAWAFDERASATVQVDVAERFVSVNDLYVEARPLPTKWLQLRAGQLKKPFSRQQVLSTTKLVLVDRAPSDEYYDAGREIGLELFGGGADRPLMWSVGVFTGTELDDHLAAPSVAPLRPEGQPGAFPSGRFLEPWTPTLVGRLELNYRDPGRSEPDLEGGPLRASVGTSGYARSELMTGEDARAVINVDGVAKWQGFAVSGALFASSAGRPGLTTHRAESIAGDARVSYTSPGMLEGALGVATVMPLAAPADAVHQLKVGMTSYLLPEGMLKVGFDVGPQVIGYDLSKARLVARAHLLLLY